MGSINTMLIIDVIIVILGIYLLFLSIRMKKTKKIASFVVPEEELKKCKNEAEFAKYLSTRQMIFAIIIIIGGTIMTLSEAAIDIGKWIYLVTGIVAVAFLVFFKQLTDGRLKYC